MNPNLHSIVQPHQRSHPHIHSRSAIRWRRLGVLALMVTLPVALVACKEAPAPRTTVPVVFVSTVHNHIGASERMLFGHLQPRVESEVSFRVGGKVLSRHVELGDSVKAGQVLGRLDPADYLLGVQSATEQVRAATVDEAQATSDALRFQRLLADGSVGAADAERQQARADAAAARLAQARAQLELARNQAAYAVLTAPFTGTVTAVHFETGQSVGSNQPVLKLAQPSVLEVQADIPEALVPSLPDLLAVARLGQSQGGGNGKDIALRLREVAPSAAAVSGTRRARFSLQAVPPNTTKWMGMAVELRLTQPDTALGAELPIGALLATGSLAVWVVNPETGALEYTPVQLLSQTTDRVRVAGLPDGVRVVSAGAHKLDAGLNVQAVARPGAER